MLFEVLMACRPKDLRANLLLQVPVGHRRFSGPYFDVAQYSETPVRVRLDACGPSANCFRPTGEKAGQRGPRCIRIAGRWFGSVPVHSAAEALTENLCPSMEDYCSLEEHDNAEITLRSGE